MSSIDNQPGEMGPPVTGDVSPVPADGAGQSMDWRLLQMSCRGFVRLLLVTTVLAYSFCQVQRDILLSWSAWSPAGGVTAEVDSGGWKWSFSSSGSTWSVDARWDKIGGSSLVESSCVLMHVKYSVDAFGRTLSGFYQWGAGLFIDSRNQVVTIVLRHTWVLSIVLALAWLVDGRRIVRWALHRWRGKVPDESGVRETIGVP